MSKEIAVVRHLGSKIRIQVLVGQITTEERMKNSDAS